MLESFFTHVIPAAVQGRSVLAYLIVFMGGVLTSFSPCILSMLPVMVGYVGGYGEQHKWRGFILSAFFVLGLATTFSILGLSAAFLGKVFGRIGSTWYLVLSLIAIAMGLNLLGVFAMKLPGFCGPAFKGKGVLGSFLVGLIFGLAASPCATPVLVVIIAYVASKGQVLYGGSLLFIYGLGHGLPLLLAGTFTSFLKSLSAFRKLSRYINLASGVLLIGVGMYFLYLWGQTF